MPENTYSFVGPIAIVVAFVLALPVMVSAELTPMSESEMRSVTGQSGMAVTKKALQNPQTLQQLKKLQNIRNAEQLKSIKDIDSMNELNQTLSSIRQSNPELSGAAKLVDAVPDPIVRQVGLSIGEAIAENPREFRRILTSETTKELLKIAGEFARIFGQVQK